MTKNKLITFLFITFISTSLSAQWNTNKMLQMGQNALYFNDNVRAIDDFNSIIRIKPYLSEPYFFRGLAKLNLSDYTGALADFSEAINLNPNYFHAFAYRAISYSRLGNYASSLEDYKKAIVLDPTVSYVYANRGQAYASMGKLDEAEKDFSKSLKIDNTQVLAYLNRALIREKLDNIEGALSDCNSAIRLNVFSDEAFRLRGYLYYQKKDYHNAIEDFNRGLKASPDNIDLLMNRAMVRYTTKDYAKSLKDYDKVIEKDSNYIFAYYNRALLRGEIGATNDAISDLDKVIDLNDNNILVFFNRALYKIEIKDWRGAYEDLSSSINLYPDFVKAYIVRASVSNELADFSSAERDRYTAHEILDRYKRMKSGDASALIDTSLNFQSLVDLNSRSDKMRDVVSGKIQNRRAIIDLKDIFFLQYTSLDSIRGAKSQYYNSYIMNFNQKHSYSPALALSDRFGSYKKEFVEAEIKMLSYKISQNDINKNDYYLLRSSFYASEGKYPQAIQDLDVILEEDANNILALFNRANFNVKTLDYIASVDASRDKVLGNSKFGFTQTDYSVVFDDYDKCLELDPGFVYAAFNKANLLAKNGRIEEAIELYTEVLEKDNHLSQAYFNRGLLYIYIGRKALAASDLSRAGELGLIDAYNIIKYYIEKATL